MLVHLDSPMMFQKVTRLTNIVLNSCLAKQHSCITNPQKYDSPSPFSFIKFLKLNTACLNNIKPFLILVVNGSRIFFQFMFVSEGLFCSENEFNCAQYHLYTSLVQFQLQAPVNLVKVGCGLVVIFYLQIWVNWCDAQKENPALTIF